MHRRLFIASTVGDDLVPSEDVFNGACIAFAHAISFSEIMQIVSVLLEIIVHSSKQNSNLAVANYHSYLVGYRFSVLISVRSHFLLATLVVKCVSHMLLEAKENSTPF